MFIIQGYYGKTDRALATRIAEEHKRAVRVADSNWKIAQHTNQFVHTNMDFDRATIVNRARDYHKRLAFPRGLVLSERDPNAGNKHIDIPGIY